jgi:hypothetical protein
MNKLRRAILVGICTALFAVLVLLAALTLKNRSPLVDVLHPGAGFLTILLDPGLHTFYLYGHAFETIAVNAIGWFLVGAAIGYFFEKIKYIIGAWVVTYVIVSILAAIVAFLNMP